MSGGGESSRDPKRHRSYNSRIISAPPRRRSVVGPGLPVLPMVEAENEEDRLHRTLYRLPGDARGSVESLEQFQIESQPGPSTEVLLNPSELERAQRRRASNLRMQNIIKSKILLPMSDVDRTPTIGSTKRASFDLSVRSLASISRDPGDTSPKGEGIPMQTLGSSLDVPQSGEISPNMSAPGRRFANIAKSITLLAGRSRVGDSSVDNSNIQEQNAFFNKYGINNQNQPQSNGLNATQAETEVHLNIYQKFGRWIRFAWKELVIDSSTDAYYHWLGIISLTYLYNLLFVIFRCVFFDDDLPYYWTICFTLTDIFCDMLYVGDIFVRSRTGYLDQGLLVRDVAKIVKAYRKTYHYYIDFISVFPADYVFAVVVRSPRPVLRFNRLIKLDRIQSFISATETRIAVPNAFRIFCVISYIIVLIHWNACIYFFVSSVIVGIGTDGWVYGRLNNQSLPPTVEDTLYRRYVYSFYWSMLILTTIGEVPGPVHNIEFAFVTLDLMCGVLIFATIVGNVGSMISNMSAARTDFQTRVDSIKQYMDLRKVSKHLEVRVIKWFDYLWATSNH